MCDEIITSYYSECNVECLHRLQFSKLLDLLSESFDLLLTEYCLRCSSLFLFLFCFKYEYKGSVASLQFGLSNLSKMVFLQYWMLGLLLICDSFDKFIAVIVAQNGKAKGSFLLFSVVNENYEYYEARTAIGLFQINELFSQRFRGFKLEYLIDATYAIRFVLLISLTSTSLFF